MGFSQAEFMRALRRTYADRNPMLHPDGADIAVGGGSVAIRMGEQSERRIALLKLPVTRISFTFAGVQAAERAEFMQHFELYFRRGGG